MSKDDPNRIRVQNFYNQRPDPLLVKDLDGYRRRGRMIFGAAVISTCTGHISPILKN